MPLTPARSLWLVVLTACPGVFLALPAQAATDPAALEHFEKKVRPLFLAQCCKCHGADKAKGGLRLDSAQGLAKGGETGPVLVPGKPADSLLIRAVRQIGDLKMPPEGKLKEQEVADLMTWIKAGAAWPGGETVVIPVPAPTPAVVALPNDKDLVRHLQAWYKADALPLTDDKPVLAWPDSSGHGHDLTVTAGVRKGGVGTAPQFVAAGTINRRPAVRFDVANGLAGSPDHPLDIHGDAALTIILVVNLKPHNAQPPFDGIVGIGNPANAAGDPGQPLAALVQIRRTSEPELQFAGGWNHDANLGPGSFKPLYDRPSLLTFVKKQGPMKSSTRCFIDGVATLGKIEGKDTVPDIQHRDDIGLYMGKAMAWSGSIRGDVSEVIIYNKALADSERGAVELYLAEKNGLLLPPMLKVQAANFTLEQKAFWAFQPVKKVAPPQVRTPQWVRSPLDQFILAKLEAAGLTPAPAADKRTLIRRATFDLTGLPPTPAEIDAFVGDTAPDAFARVVDRLLESPHYGERWGRHWLDLVRYGETTANDANAVMRYTYRYRDYVISAFNKDKPYDQFIIEQLAGDLLPNEPGGLSPRSAERIIATGFLMVGPKALAETDKEQTRLDIVDDQLDVTGRTFLGLTLGCARCHDHKFDPIPTVDYYALAGIFRSTEVFRDEVRNASMWQEWPLPAAPGQKPVQVMAPREGTPVNLRVHLRGNRHNLGQVVPRGFLQVLAGAPAPLHLAGSGRLELARWIAGKDNPLTARVMVNRIWQHHFGTGLVGTSDNFGVRGEKPSHPELLDYLAARFVEEKWSVKAMHRVMLLSSTYQISSVGNERALQVDPGNRLLWHMPRPRLDAESLRDSLLAVSGRLDATLGGDDGAEFLYSAGEVIDKKRDFFRPNQVRGDHSYYTTSRRRSIYLPVVRNALPDILTLFDAADPNGVTAVRNDTTVPSQALFLLNHPFVREQALHFARSALADPKATSAERIHSIYRTALGREPRSEETADATTFLERYEAQARAKGRKPEEARLTAWQSFCQTMFCRNEFLYVE